jgi:hypothetical protein
LKARWLPVAISENPHAARYALLRDSDDIERKTVLQIPPGDLAEPIPLTRVAVATETHQLFQECLTQTACSFQLLFIESQD